MSGSSIEKELLGETSERREFNFENYQKYSEAMEAAKKLQPGDPKDPKTDFAYEVLVQLEDLLGAEDQIGFYTAVGTILDHMHGVDAWFELDDGRIATIDVTTARGGKGGAKADIDFAVPHDGLDRSVDEEQFLKFAKVLVARVAEVFAEEEQVVYKAS